MRLWALALLLAAAPASAADLSGPYGVVETVSDGVYGLVRGHLFAAVLPTGLSRQMARAPQSSSYALFEDTLRRNQDDAERRIVATRASGAAALSIERDAVTDALADSLVARYQLEKFGRASGAYASDVRHWDAEFLASSAVLGGAYLYVAGLRADWTLGRVRVDLDTKPGYALRQGDLRSLGALSFRQKGGALALRLEADRYSVSYSRKF